jgi:tRNA-dihydrouridine synthase B
MNTLDSTREQLAAVNAFFDEQEQFSDRLIYSDVEPGDTASEPDTLDRLAA